MGSFKAYLIEQEAGYKEYCIAVDVSLGLTESSTLDESFLSGIKDKIEFLKQFVSQFSTNVRDIANFLKNTKVYNFFSKISFNIEKIIDLVKAGFKAYEALQKCIAEFIANTKLVKWTTEKLKELDVFLQKHPLLAKIGGFAVAGLLLYIWLNMSFTGDFNYDFDFSDIIKALGGSYSLSTLFGGTDGTRMLMLLATGVMGFGVNYALSTTAKISLAIFNGLRKIT